LKEEKKEKQIEENEKQVDKKKLTEKDKEIDKKWSKFFNYFRMTTIVGIAYGLLFGWMWGKKGLIYGPILGIVVGTILALLFTFDKRNQHIDRDQYL